jgi:hypothetical protein
MRQVCLVVIAILMASVSCLAQPTGSGEQETVRLLVQQVKELQEKVNALETRQAAQPGTKPDSPPQAETLEEPANTTALSADFPQEVRGIQWRGFGEVDYKALNHAAAVLGTSGFVPGSAGNFYTGVMDLLLTSKLGDRTSFLSEISFEERDAQSYKVELARVLLKYDYNDHLRMSFGRYHTGIGYYNTAFHSGKWLQTTVDRPLIMEFADDGGLLPTQAIGVSVTGLIPSERLGLN